MNDLEQDLRKALSRREAPPGFSDRVLARLPRQRGYPRWLALVATLLIAIAGLSAWQLRQRQQRIAAEKARADFVRALVITTSTLETTRALLQRTTGGRTI
jgi:hypothetical protein